MLHVKDDSLDKNNEYSSRNDVDIFSESLMKFRDEAYDALLKVLDMDVIFKLSREELHAEVERFISFFTQKNNYRVTRPEQSEIATSIVNDMVGFGPLEKLLGDKSISDIVVNRYDKIYIERNGNMFLSSVRFRDEEHVTQIAQRIAQNIGRRVDTANPICDARLPDGSRVNIVMPPIALDGVSISIRKFGKNDITLDDLYKYDSMSEDMMNFLKIASRAALNIIVSGGTGSGKTTLLNALSSMIDNKERIVTCEDAAELKLQQPNVVRMESRMSNIEGKGEIKIRDLVRSALRMRPDRIIVGEVRGDECIDMLQAMNTGHDGSMSTVHANSSKEAMTRIENMVAISGYSLPIDVIRAQISGAIDIIVQTERLHDGSRKVMEIIEILGKEDNEIKYQKLFEFIPKGFRDGKVVGEFNNLHIKPICYSKVLTYGLGEELLNIMGIDENGKLINDPSRSIFDSEETDPKKFIDDLKNETSDFNGHVNEIKDDSLTQNNND